ncbi:MAG: choice-of-anchor A family protein, partial [Ruminiclostridium sp.]|nr:choice-of-anchor A family protein [Ruminiclostridium sp.]
VGLYNDFYLDNYVVRSERKINFKVTTDETFAEGETKTYTFGVFCNGEIIDVIYNGEIGKGLIDVEFDQAGDKSFTVTIPDQYRYETVTIYKINFVVDEDGSTRITTSEAGVDILPHSDSKEELIHSSASCLIGSSLKLGNAMIGENKIINVAPNIYDKVTQENDGRYSFEQDGYNIIFANPSNTINNRPEAKEDIDKLLAQIKGASETLSKVEKGSNRVLFGVLEGTDLSYENENTANIEVIPAVGESYMKSIVELYNEVKENPELTMLINVKLDENISSFGMRFHSCVDNWDVDTASRIIFNFIGATEGVTTIYLGDGFRGTVLAPNARVSNESTILGAIYADGVSNPGGEIHRASYRSFVDYYQAFFY